MTFYTRGFYVKKSKFCSESDKIADALRVDLLFHYYDGYSLYQVPSIVIDNKNHRKYSIVIDINLPYFLL
jgi:hypothetical protein